MAIVQKIIYPYRLQIYNVIFSHIKNYIPIQQFIYLNNVFLHIYFLNRKKTGSRCFFFNSHGIFFYNVTEKNKDYS